MCQGRREILGRKGWKKEQGEEGTISEKCVFSLHQPDPGSQAAKNAQKKTLMQYHTFNYT